MRKDTGRLGEVARRHLQPVDIDVVRRDAQLAVERREVVEDVEELVLEVVLDERSVGIVPQGRIPREVGADLSSLACQPGYRRVGAEDCDRLHRWETWIRRTRSAPRTPGVS